MPISSLEFTPRTASSICRHLLAFLLSALLACSAFGQAPDFSDIDTREKLMALVADGKLERVHLFPLRAGGQDHEVNVVYLPIGFKDAKARLDDTVIRMAREGSISTLTVRPEYKGKSRVPSRLLVEASHPQKPGKFEATIDIW